MQIQINDIIIVLSHFDYSDMVYDPASETSNLILKSCRHG